MKLPHRTAQQLKAAMCHSWRAATRAAKTQQTTAQVLKKTPIQLSLISELERSSGRFTVEFDHILKHKFHQRSSSVFGHVDYFGLMHVVFLNMFFFFLRCLEEHIFDKS